MARTGPNQDINDPNDIIKLGHRYQLRSENLGNFLAMSTTKDPNATGPPIVDVSIPFRIGDGSTFFMDATDISVGEIGGVFLYDTDLVSSANIITYVDLPERFRDYWSEMRNVTSALEDFFFLTEQTSPGFSDPQDIYLEEDGSLGSVNSVYRLGTFIFQGEDSTLGPWLGFGPTNYTSETFPQLLGVADGLISPGFIGLFQAEWDTNYFYKRGGTLLGFGFNFPFSSRFVQFYNPYTSNISISLSVSMMAVHASSGFVLQYESWAEIDNLDFFPIVSDLTTLSSYVKLTNSSSSTTKTLSNTRNVIIPPGKSAFIRAEANDIDVDSSGTYDVTLTLNGRSVSYSHIFT